MPPAAAAAVPAVIGLTGGITAAATGAGKSRFATQTFNQSSTYNPQDSMYGGTYGGEDNAANTAGGYMNEYLDVSRANEGRAYDAFNNAQADRGLALGDRGAVDDAVGLSIQDRNKGLQDRAKAGQSRGLSLQSRGMQQQIGNLQIQRALGQNLISDREADAARRNLAQQMGSAAASARGPAALANAQSDAMAAQAQGLGQINSQATTAALQEQQANEAAAAGTAGAIRTGDLNLNQQDIGQQNTDVNQRTQDINQGTLGVNKMNADTGVMNADTGVMNGANSAMSSAGNIGLGYGNLQNNIRTAGGNLRMHGQDTQAKSFMQKQDIDSGTAQHSADTDLGYIKMAAGGASGGGQAGSMIPGSPPTGGTPPVPAAEHGGHVKGGPTYLVGEKGEEAAVTPKGDVSIVGQHGPELVQFQKDATVIPAPQTADVMALYEPPGKQLHQSAEGHGYLTDGPTEDTTRPSLSGPYTGVGAPHSIAIQATPAHKAPPVAPKAMRAPTPEELMAQADALHAQMKAQHEALMAAGPAVSARCMGGPVYAREEGGPVVGSPEQLDRPMVQRHVQQHAPSHAAAEESMGDWARRQTRAFNRAIDEDALAAADWAKSHPSVVGAAQGLGDVVKQKQDNMAQAAGYASPAEASAANGDRNIATAQKYIPAPVQQYVQQKLQAAAPAPPTRDPVEFVRDQPQPPPAAAARATEQQLPAAPAEHHAAIAHAIEQLAKRLKGMATSG